MSSLQTRLGRVLTFDFSRRKIVWVVNMATDLLSSKVTLMVGNAACMFCGLGGRIKIGTIPNIGNNAAINLYLVHDITN